MSSKKTSKKSSKKGAARKGTSSKSSNGRAAAEKGKKFEDEVAELYRLQGAEVIQNIMISQKKVDIVATFSYPVRHRVIVECKDEKRAVDANQRVMQFHGLLETLRRTGEAESAEIITRVPWGDAAKGYALTAGIGLFTYTEKLSKLIDFTPYLKELVSRFEQGQPGRKTEPALGKYYIDLSAQIYVEGKIEKLPVIDTYIHEWLWQGNAQRQLAIFGEYGSGKSSLCQKLSHDLANKYLADPSSNRIPILLNLREFIGKLDIEAFITSFLDRECRVANPKIDIFRAMTNAGIFLMIFDGFDEMAVKVDSETLEANLAEIDKMATLPLNKVLLTSRPEYFSTQKEETEALRPSLLLLSGREAEYEPIKILPWDETQVERFLEKRVPLIKEATEPWTYYRDRIKSIGSLADLSRRPVLLDMIVKTLPRLIASKLPINLPNLYQEYIRGEINRQRIRKGRKLLLKEENRLAILRQIAVDLYTKEIPTITFAEARKRVELIIKPPQEDVEPLTRDFLTNSFLVRSGNEYIFSHKSIQEYLVAVHLGTEIEADAPVVFGKYYNQPVIVEFMKELNPNPTVLWNWINRTKGMVASVDTFYLGSNAATLLCAMSTDALKGQDLAGTQLVNANLTNAVLTDTNLKGASLADADLTSADLRGADLENTDLTGAKLAGAKFLYEDVKHAILRDNLFSVAAYHKDISYNKLNREIFRKLGNDVLSKLSDGTENPYIGMVQGSVLFLNIEFDIERYDNYKAELESEKNIVLALYADEMALIPQPSGDWFFMSL